MCARLKKREREGDQYDVEEKEGKRTVHSEVRVNKGRGAE